MSKIFKVIRKNAIANLILNELVILKLWKRNWKAKSVIQADSMKANEILDRVSENRVHIYFLCVPTHRNMGDQAQRYCITNWLKENYMDYQVIPISSWPFYDKAFRERFKKLIKDDDLFVFQSGYCTTSTHYDHFVHRYIARTYTNNKILIMPQTVSFLTEHQAKRTAKIYNKHSQLLFLARDKVSFSIAKKFFFHTEVALYPDIVTTLIGSRLFDEKRQGVLLCVRNDGEKLYGNAVIEMLHGKFKNAGIPCDVTDTNCDLPQDELVKNFEVELDKVLRKFASYQVVITDRYHGTIFSMIANTPVIVLATNDHKVKTGTEWFKGIYDGAYYNADSIEEAQLLANDVLTKKKVIQNTPYFKAAYYDKLKTLFEHKVVE